MQGQGMKTSHSEQGLLETAEITSSLNHLTLTNSLLWDLAFEAYKGNASRLQTQWSENKNVFVAADFNYRNRYFPVSVWWLLVNALEAHHIKLALFDELWEAFKSTLTAEEFFQSQANKRSIWWHFTATLAKYFPHSESLIARKEIHTTSKAIFSKIFQETWLRFSPQLQQSQLIQSSLYCNGTMPIRFLLLSLISGVIKSEIIETIFNNFSFTIKDLSKPLLSPEPSSWWLFVYAAALGHLPSRVLTGFIKKNIAELTATELKEKSPTYNNTHYLSVFWLLASLLAQGHLHAEIFINLWDKVRTQFTLADLRATTDKEQATIILHLLEALKKNFIPRAFVNEFLLQVRENLAPQDLHASYPDNPSNVFQLLIENVVRGNLAVGHRTYLHRRFLPLIAWDEILALKLPVKIKKLWFSCYLIAKQMLPPATLIGLISYSSSTYKDWTTAEKTGIFKEQSAIFHIAFAIANWQEPAAKLLPDPLQNWTMFWPNRDPAHAPRSFNSRAHVTGKALLWLLSWSLYTTKQPHYLAALKNIFSLFEKKLSSLTIEHLSLQFKTSSQHQYGLSFFALIARLAIAYPRFLAQILKDLSPMLNIDHLSEFSQIDDEEPISILELLLQAAIKHKIFRDNLSTLLIRCKGPRLHALITQSRNNSRIEEIFETSNKRWLIELKAQLFLPCYLKKILADLAAITITTEISEELASLTTTTASLGYIEAFQQLGDFYLSKNLYAYAKAAYQAVMNTNLRAQLIEKALKNELLYTFQSIVDGQSQNKHQALTTAAEKAYQEGLREAYQILTLYVQLQASITPAPLAASAWHSPLFTPFNELSKQVATYQLLSSQEQNSEIKTLKDTDEVSLCVKNHHAAKSSNNP